MILGGPLAATRSHRILPDLRFRQYTLKLCAGSPLTGAMSPYRPTFNDDSPLAGTALVTKMRSPQTTGLEWPRPGIAVSQRMFLPDATFHSVGGAPLPRPPADGPRNWGQFAPVASAALLPGRAAKASRQIAQSFMDASIAKSSFQLLKNSAETRR